ncbi:MAG: hypothetical protein ABIL18_04500 [candidate division WOR-3 bacterium]
MAYMASKGNERQIKEQNETSLVGCEKRFVFRNSFVVKRNRYTKPFRFSKPSDETQSLIISCSLVLLPS